jgi:glucose-1-phosphate thymidylyltransferase
LNEASNFVKMIEDRQGIKISAPEEIAYLNKWISKEQLISAATRYGKSPYGEHLFHIAKGEIFQ